MQPKTRWSSAELEYIHMRMKWIVSWWNLISKSRVRRNKAASIPWQSVVAQSYSNNNNGEAALGEDDDDGRKNSSAVLSFNNTVSGRTTDQSAVVMVLNAENGMVNVWDDAHHPHHAHTETESRRKWWRSEGPFPDRSRKQQHSSRRLSTATNAQSRLVYPERRRRRTVIGRPFVVCPTRLFSNSCKFINNRHVAGGFPWEISHWLSLLSELFRPPRPPMSYMQHHVARTWISIYSIVEWMVVIPAVSFLHTTISRLPLPALHLPPIQHLCIWSEADNTSSASPINDDDHRTCQSNSNEPLRIGRSILFLSSPNFHSMNESSSYRQTAPSQRRDLFAPSLVLFVLHLVAKYAMDGYGQTDKWWRAEGGGGGGVSEWGRD